MSDQPNPALFAHWPEDRRAEILANWNNRSVGSHIVSETDKVRVWHLTVPPGGRAPFHRHCESYFWTSIGPGKSRSYYSDGSIKEAEYEAGTTKHFDLSEENFFVHDLENIGDTTMTFVTVEYKR